MIKYIDEKYHFMSGQDDDDDLNALAEKIVAESEELNQMSEAELLRYRALELRNLVMTERAQLQMDLFFSGRLGPAIWSDPGFREHFQPVVVRAFREFSGSASSRSSVHPS